LGNTPIPRERSQKENGLEIDRGVAISKSSAGIFGFLVWAVLFDVVTCILYSRPAFRYARAVA
jgi:hypothetical protein